ncbi:MAG: TrmH family RNA methyltransferase [Flavobacteriales bacterium]|nr:TrmH family RNA methyltransferase [Flavobacteriales bacterium]
MNELGRKTLSEFKRADKIAVTVVLDDVRSLHNVGSVFRTADAFSIEGIILCGITACPPHREIEKTALGATESVHWEHQKDIIQALNELRSDDYTICGIEQVAGSVELQNYQVKPHSKLAVVFGNEVKGVSQEVLNLCDEFIEIPQSGTKHSLNISVSAGIVLWELYRQFGELS